MILILNKSLRVQLCHSLQQNVTKNRQITLKLLLCVSAVSKPSLSTRSKILWSCSKLYVNWYLIDTKHAPFQDKTAMLSATSMDYQSFSLLRNAKVSLKNI